MTVATVAPRPNRLATRRAATTFAPDDVPAKIPSSRANRRAIALARSLTVITRNIREFGRIRNLKIENWEV